MRCGIGFPGHRGFPPGGAERGKVGRSGHSLRALHGDLAINLLISQIDRSGLTNKVSSLSSNNAFSPVFQPTPLGQRPRLQVPRGRRSHGRLQQQRGDAAPPERPCGSAARRAFQGKGCLLPAQSSVHLMVSRLCWNYGVNRSRSFFLPPVSLFLVKSLLLRCAIFF